MNISILCLDAKQSYFLCNSILSFTEFVMLMFYDWGLGVIPPLHKKAMRKNFYYRITIIIIIVVGIRGS